LTRGEEYSEPHLLFNSNAEKRVKKEKIQFLTWEEEKKGRGPPEKKRTIAVFITEEEREPVLRFSQAKTGGEGKGLYHFVGEKRRKSCGKKK